MSHARPRWYGLDNDGVPYPVNGYEEGACFFENGRNKFALKDEVMGHEVSTVFLSLDHNHFGVGEPILWETMVFGPHVTDEMCRRGGTFKDAQRMHNRMVKRLPLLIAKARLTQ